ncbi:MBL fold metallo-hydrolase [Blastococcus sp. URHD0036]|uniref:MBL fold metallo-hydrolase n=1 Tax=Blastococcus sp. URHD0036 TaxID=1380356 RepID=UPI000497EFAC|nr:MBL fold metallo-hydrolase [Blastococcus sp. URHD0036]
MDSDVEITGPAQRAAWLAREVPPVEQLREDLWSIPVPMPDNPLRYITAYVFALAGGGLGMVDTGWDSDDAWDALRAGLTAIGGDVADVRGVLVTHMHGDHNGLSNRVRDASGAWVAMHPADADIVRGMQHVDVEQFIREQAAYMVSLGADPETAASDAPTPERLAGLRRQAVPDRLLEDGDLADFPGWSLRAVHTPGHTPGHLCFAEERTGLFLAGDHVLPRISPNISAGQRLEEDPLRDYLSSLASVADREEPVEVLPAHEWRFRGLGLRTRELTAHHEQRLAELLDAIRTHPHSTPWELAGHLTWSRPWEQYANSMRMFAVTETVAHLRLLASRGLVVGSDGAVVTWTVAVR